MFLKIHQILRVCVCVFWLVLASKLRKLNLIFSLWDLLHGMRLINISLLTVFYK